MNPSALGYFALPLAVGVGVKASQTTSEALDKVGHLVRKGDVELAQGLVDGLVAIPVKADALELLDLDIDQDADDLLEDLRVVFIASPLAAAATAKRRRTATAPRRRRRRPRRRSGRQRSSPYPLQSQRDHQAGDQ